MQQKIIALVLILLSTACAGSTSTSSPGASVPAGERPGDPALYPLLSAVPMTPEQQNALVQYELDHLHDFSDRVAVIAEDPRAGTEARYNAVMILGERRRATALSSLRIAATDRDPRVRAAVVLAASMISEGGREGRDIVEAGLNDPAPEVQAKALEVLGPSNLPLLRAFVQREPKGDVAAIAREMIRVAEERGAPLAADSLGVLRRTVGEVSLQFTPVQRWPEWQLAVGRLTITPKSGSAFTLDSVEVARGVVPAFFSPDARYVVYEHGRSIFVRELASGAVRALGPGLAPRPRPFAEDFVFVREQTAARADARERIRLRYDVVRAPFDAEGGAPEVLGTIGGFAQMNASANASPARWIRVVETGAKFSLEAENLETFKLPDPFKAGAGK